MNIFVNATAARNSGALTILKQFLNALPNFSGENLFFIFVSQEQIFDEISGVEFIRIDTIKWIKRIHWDSIGLKKWAKSHQVFPDLIVSFQNTGVNYKSIPQLIYYHQPLPLAKYKWNPLIPNQLIYFLYANMYPFFIKKYLTPNTHIVVQIQSVKNAFIEKFKIPPCQISIIRPDILDLDFENVKTFLLDSSYTHFFFPATPLLYKNHIELVEALNILRRKDTEIVKKIKIHLTCNENKKLDFVKKIHKYQLADCFIFEGEKTFTDILRFYKSVNALVFPSFIESFGLPLIEAASAGLPIICADLSYSRDVLEDYDGVNFIEIHNSNLWADAIVKIVNNCKRYPPLKPSKNSEWGLFFNIIQKMIESNYVKTNY